MTVQISVRAELGGTRSWLRSIERQVPFATAVALSKTAQDVKTNLQKGIRKDLDRPTPFTMRGFRVRRATRRRLEAEVFLAPIQQEYLAWAIFGGTRRPRTKVIVVGQGRRNQYGNTPRFRTLRTRLLQNPKNFEDTIRGTPGIWQRRKKGGPKLLALYISEAQYERRFRFFERAEKTARARFQTQFDRAIANAIRTAR